MAIRHLPSKLLYRQVKFAMTLYSEATAKYTHFHSFIRFPTQANDISCLTLIINNGFWVDFIGP